MKPIISVVAGSAQMHFYPDGTFSGTPPGCIVINKYPLVVRQIQAALYEYIQTGKTLSHFADWFNRTIGVNDSVGSSQGMEENSNNILSQTGDEPGGK